MLCHPLVTPTEVLLIIRSLAKYAEDCGENGDLDAMNLCVKLISELSHEIGAKDE